MERGPYLSSGNEAFINLIPKPGKNAILPSSYRSISLIDIDVKLLSKIIANRLAKVMPSLFHPVQAFFVKGRSGTIQFSGVLKQAQRNPHTQSAIMTLDAKKAFDNVNLEWMFQALDNRDK